MFPVFNVTYFEFDTPISNRPGLTILFGGCKAISAVHASNGIAVTFTTFRDVVEARMRHQVTKTHGNQISPMEAAERHPEAMSHAPIMEIFEEFGLGNEEWRNA